MSPDLSELSLTGSSHAQRLDVVPGSSGPGGVPVNTYNGRDEQPHTDRTRTRPSVLMRAGEGELGCAVCEKTVMLTNGCFGSAELTGH